MTTLPGAVPGTPCGCRERCFHEVIALLKVRARLAREMWQVADYPREALRQRMLEAEAALDSVREFAESEADMIRSPKDVRQTFELDRPVTLICTESKRPAAWGFRLIVKFDDSSWPEPVYLTVHHGLGTRDKIMQYAEIRGWKVEER